MKPDGCPHSDCARCNGTVAKLEAQVEILRDETLHRPCIVCAQLEQQLEKMDVAHAETRLLAQDVVDYMRCYGGHFPVVETLEAHLEETR